MIWTKKRNCILCVKSSRVRPVRLAFIEGERDAVALAQFTDVLWIATFELAAGVHYCRLLVEDGRGAQCDDVRTKCLTERDVMLVIPDAASDDPHASVRVLSEGLTT